MRKRREMALAGQGMEVCGSLLPGSTWTVGRTPEEDTGCAGAPPALPEHSRPHRGREVEKSRDLPERL